MIQGCHWGTAASRELYSQTILYLDRTMPFSKGMWTEMMCYNDSYEVSVSFPSFLSAHNSWLQRTTWLQGMAEPQGRRSQVTWLIWWGSVSNEPKTCATALYCYISKKQNNCMKPLKYCLFYIRAAKIMLNHISDISLISIKIHVQYFLWTFNWNMYLILYIDLINLNSLLHTDSL